MIVVTRLKLHREVLAGTVGEMRPGIPVHIVAPDQIEAYSPCRSPRLVIASDRETIARLRPFASILLYPGDADVAVANIDGRVGVMANASITDIIGVIDQVWPAPIGAPQDHMDDA